MGDVLSVLPLFHVLDVVRSADGTAVVQGRLDNCFIKNDGPRWFWLWPSENDAITPSMKDLDETSGKVTIIIDHSDMRDSIRAGATLHWLTPYWQAYHVPMILAGQWTKLEFKAEDAIRFAMNGWQGWARHDGAIPEGAVRTGVESGGWDHEHCEICNSRIGYEGSPVGYIDADEHWLCPNCYDKWAVTRSLGFLAGEE